VDAEVYYVSGSGMPAGLAYEVARWRRAGFINHAASDYDLLRSAPRRSGTRDRWWYRRAIRGADALLAQTEFQKQGFASMFGLGSEVLPNLVEIPARAVDPGQGGPIVWLGTYKSIKRPEWFTRLARDLPEQRFVMVGVVPPPPLTQQHWDAARAAARDLPNLEMRGFMDHDQLEKLFRTASVLVHTSPVEGFSNVMLEAWSYGLPTISCVDPDDIVKRECLGDAVGEYADLVSAVRRRMSDPAGRREAGARARAYVMARHAPGVVLDRLAGILDRVVGKVRERRGQGEATR
jgi:glycosyltransferase involved in cell wall biosynthesis